MKIGDQTAIYEACRADIALIEETFTDGRCKDPALARSRLIGAKEKWRELIRQNKGTEIEAVVSQALTRLPNANHRPDRWRPYLYDAADDFGFRLYNLRH